jgi:isopentenyl diphosphate isomerase/L-lactate dehydrogenase-like FMN-dependent dehydrogenase
MAVVTREFEPALTPDDVGWLAGLSGLPVVAKGVQRADDAVRCIEAGASAIVVSNHGGRQLDDAPATADILPEIVDAVAGRVEVYVDGGIRRAPDVAKALALGARAVMVGRPSLWALAAGGAEGVASLLRWYESELRRTMALCGTATVEAIDRSLVRRATRSSTMDGVP